MVYSGFGQDRQRAAAQKRMQISQEEIRIFAEAEQPHTPGIVQVSIEDAGQTGAPALRKRSVVVAGAEGQELHEKTAIQGERLAVGVRPCSRMSMPSVANGLVIRSQLLY